jgi:hypothetical protein
MSKDSKEKDLEQPIKLSDEVKKKLTKTVRKIKRVLPLDEGSFTPNLRPVNSSYYTGESSEYSRFARFPDDRSQHSTYGMTEPERKENTVTLQNNQLVNGDGQQVNNGNYLYNVTKDKRLILNLKGIAMNHSSITRDAAVICAGFLDIADGKITQINTSSGHYTPSNLDLYNAVTTLDQNYFAANCSVLPFGGNSTNLADFKTYMESPELGKSISRLEEMRQARTAEHKKMPQIIKITEKGANLADTILKNETLLKGGLNSTYQFPADLFSEQFQQDYRNKILPYESKHKIQNISMSLNEIFEHLSTFKDAQQLLINQGISHENDSTLIVGLYNKCNQYQQQHIVDKLFESDKPEHIESLCTLAQNNEKIANRLISDKLEETIPILSSLNQWDFQNIYNKCEPDNQKQIVTKLFESDKPNIRKLCEFAQHNQKIANRLIEEKFEASIPIFSSLEPIFQNIYNKCEQENQKQIVDKLFESDKLDIKTLCTLAGDIDEIADRLIKDRLEATIQIFSLDPSPVSSIYARCNKSNKEKIVAAVLYDNKSDVKLLCALAQINTKIADHLIQNKLEESIPIIYLDERIVSWIYNKCTQDNKNKIINKFFESIKPEYNETLCRLAIYNKEIANYLIQDRLNESVTILGSLNFENFKIIYNNLNQDNQKQIVDKLFDDGKPEYIKTLCGLAQTDTKITNRLIENRFEEGIQVISTNLDFVYQIYKSCSPDNKEKIVNKLLEEDKPEYIKTLFILTYADQNIANRLVEKKLNENIQTLISDPSFVSYVYDYCSPENKKQIEDKLFETNKPEYIKTLCELARNNEQIANRLIQNRLEESIQTFNSNPIIAAHIYNCCDKDNKEKIICKIFETDKPDIKLLCELARTNKQIADYLIQDRLDESIETFSLATHYLHVVYGSCNQDNKEKIITSIIRDNNNNLINDQFYYLISDKLSQINILKDDFDKCSTEQTKSLALNIEGLQKLGLDKAETLNVCKLGSDVLKKVIDTSKDKASLLAKVEASHILGPAQKHLTKSASVDSLAGSFVEKLKAERSKSAPNIKM